MNNLFETKSNFEIESEINTSLNKYFCETMNKRFYCSDPIGKKEILPDILINAINNKKHKNYFLIRLIIKL